MTATPHAKPWLVDFILLAAIWGASFLFTRIGVGEFGALATAALRVSIASLFLLPLALAKGHGPQLLAHWQRAAVVGLLNSAIPFVCFAYALLSISSGLSAILNATVPLFGAVVAWAWLKDRPTGSRTLGLVIGFVGVTLLAWKKSSFTASADGVATGWAVLACLLACLCYGLAASFTKRYMAGLPSLVSATGSQLSATVLLLYFRIIERAGPAKALTVTFAIPVFAVLYGVLLLGEEVTPWMVGCGLVIIAGTTLSTGLVVFRRHPR